MTGHAQFPFPNRRTSAGSRRPTIHHPTSVGRRHAEPLSPRISINMPSSGSEKRPSPNMSFRSSRKQICSSRALTAPLPVQWLKRLGVHNILGVVKVEEWDYIHTPILCDKMSRSGLLGPGASLTTGMAFGVPPLLKLGSRKLQERFLPELLLGKKRTCIAITEPGAGSDVARRRMGNIM